MEEQPTSLELSDIPNVRPLIPSPALPGWFWGAMAAVCIVLAVTLVMALKSRKSKPATLRQIAFREAMASLEKARLISAPVALATAVSLAIRRYLASSFADPSLFETHEEFLSRHHALATLPESTRQRLAQEYDHLARMKYAPMEMQQDISGLVTQMIQLLEHLHSVHPVSTAAP